MATPDRVGWYLLSVGLALVGHHVGTDIYFGFVLVASAENNMSSDIHITPRTEWTRIEGEGDEPPPRFWFYFSWVFLNTTKCLKSLSIFFAIAFLLKS